MAQSKSPAVTKKLRGNRTFCCSRRTEATTSVGRNRCFKVFEAKEMQIGEVLSGTTLTVNLNGVAKKISFNESEKISFQQLKV